MAGKNSCGPTMSSSCVFFSGKTLSILGNEPFSCDTTIDDVIEKLDIKIKGLMDSNDFTSLQVPSCFTFEPLTVTASELHQLELDRICENTTDIEQLEESFNALDIGQKNVNITLPDCLQADSLPCATGSNQYSLLSLLNLFASMLCDHETRISNLES